MQLAMAPSARAAARSLSPKVGAGKLVLGGLNTYSGGTNIPNGIVTADNFQALGTGPVTLSGGTLQLGGDASVSFAVNAVGIKFASGDIGGKPAAGSTGTAYTLLGGAGVVAQKNWNNVYGATGSAASLVNAANSNTGMAVTWNAPSTWNALGASYISNGGLLNSYLSNAVPGSNAQGPTNVTPLIRPPRSR